MKYSQINGIGKSRAKARALLETLRTIPLRVLHDYQCPYHRTYFQSEVTTNFQRTENFNYATNF